MCWQQKSMAILGYARTSTRDQEAGLQAQIRDLIATGCAERDIYTEQASSVRERPELDLLRRRILRPGDELVVTRLDRLARSARDTLALAEELGQRGVTLKILDPAMTIEPPGSGRSSASPEAPCCMDRRCGRTEPRPMPGHTMRTYFGRPSFSIRFSTSAAMAMCGRPPRCKEKMEDQQLGQVRSCVRPRKMRYA